MPCAAKCNTWLLIKLTLTGVAFSFHFFLGMDLTAADMSSLDVQQQAPTSVIAKPTTTKQALSCSDSVAC